MGTATSPAAEPVPNLGVTADAKGGLVVLISCVDSSPILVVSKHGPVRSQEVCSRRADHVPVG